jgi:hypothetical protein
MLKNAPAYRQAGICPALRGIALILALLDEQIDFGERLVKTSALKWLKRSQNSI